MKRWIHSSIEINHANTIKIGDCISEIDEDDFNRVADIKDGKNGSVMIKFEGSDRYVSYDPGEQLKVQR